MKDITYKNDTLQMINKLSIISDSIIATKSGDGKSLIINRQSPNEQITFFFSGPINGLDFEGDEIAFYNFPEFFQLYSVFNNPKLTHDENKIVLSSGKSKIKYITGESEVLKESPTSFDISEEPNCLFTLTEDDLKNLSKMIGLVKSEELGICVDGKSLKLKLGNGEDEHSFEREFEMEDDSEATFNFNIPSDVFVKIPEGAYIMSIWEDGIVMLTFKTKDFNLDIMTSELDEEI